MTHRSSRVNGRPVRIFTRESSSSNVGRPVGSGSKTQTTVRLSNEVLSFFRATGPVGKHGWTRPSRNTWQRVSADLVPWRGTRDRLNSSDHAVHFRYQGRVKPAPLAGGRRPPELTRSGPL